MTGCTLINSVNERGVGQLRVSECRARALRCYVLLPGTGTGTGTGPGPVGGGGGGHHRVLHKLDALPRLVVVDGRHSHWPTVATPLRPFDAICAALSELGLIKRPQAKRPGRVIRRAAPALSSHLGQHRSSDKKH